MLLIATLARLLAVSSVTISNVVPRRTTDGAIINAHAGGIYNFSGTFYLIGEHYKSCPHAGGNRTADPLAIGNCEICGHTGSTFALYESPDLKSWTLKTANVIPALGGPSYTLYTPVLVYNAALKYYVLMFQCDGGAACGPGQLQVRGSHTDQRIPEAGS